MSLTVRRATLADLEALTPLFDAYRSFYGQPSAPEIARAFLRDRFRESSSVVLAAEDGGTLIGFTQLYPSFSSVRVARIWVLNDLFVAPEGRRHGAARALLDAAVAFARDDGAIRVVLETMPDNAPAQALYRSAGWAADNTMRRYRFSLETQ